MKRKLLILLAATLLLFSLIGCASSEEPVVVNFENKEDLHNTTFGADALVYIGNGLYYDSATRIVYLHNSTYNAYSVITPYYAPNGLPYKYNPVTNTFEEIEVE